MAGAYAVGGGGGDESDEVVTAQGGRVRRQSAVFGSEAQRPLDPWATHPGTLPSYVPGPGEYEVDGLTRTGRAEALHIPLIGTEPRDTGGVRRGSHLLPGPGAHETVGAHHEWGRKRTDEGLSFGREEQRLPEPALVAASRVPGPGSLRPHTLGA
jgi:hypothetical protein